MAKETALDAIGARHLRELGGRDRRATIIVRVQRDAHVLTITDIAAEVLDLVGVGVRSTHLDGSRQIKDDLTAWPRLPHVHHGVTDLDSEVRAGLAKDLRRVLVAELNVAEVLVGVPDDPLSTTVRQVNALLFVDVEDNASEEFGNCVIHVDSGTVSAD